MIVKNYTQTLGRLLALPHNVHIARAAARVVAQAYVKANPTSSVDECDADTLAWRERA